MNTARQMGVKASDRFFAELAGRKVKAEAPKAEAPMSEEERAAVKAEIARIKRISQ